ncbi:N-(5-amino-5-carboxypentanoyl)-L-cysteinyl-D-valine synthase [Folsomia candida]|uniref:N-(5-amino-5-carboxypentanoyl)-L-cysteinyl-D-valine synthase n=1 Tax=Folsomia candida TaxID=158441 RepID=A0A226CXU5_FOLCA|nr:N-(5-amino-5-carboxypentanoyl)-L-cysteinyl-D-valine synthase [Folsomia candida]
MNYWTTRLGQYTERCDFNGLPKNGIKSGHLPHHLSVRKVTIPDQFRLLNSSPIPCTANLVELAWHKVLSIYGTGNYTVVLTGIPGHEQDNHFVPIVMDHHHINDKPIIETLQEIVTQTSNNSLTMDQVLEMNVTLFDGLLLLDEKMDTLASEILAKFPISIILLHDSVRISYSQELFTEDVIDGMLDVLTTILEQFVQDINQPLGNVNVLPEIQRVQISSWNGGSQDFPKDKRLHHLFEQAAAQTPDKIAVINPKGNVHLTYRQLNEKSNQLAHYLKFNVGVQPEQLIALFLDKSESLVITVLAIWKSGAAYTPIDPTYPDARVKFTFDDTKAKLAITNGRHYDRLRTICSDEEIFKIETLLEKTEADSVPVANLELGLTSSQLAYVTYTSGTTGEPKGVHKEHKGVVNSITDLSIKYSMHNKPEVVCLFSAYVFEPFVRQSLIALINSHQLVIVDDEEKLDLDRFPEFLQKYGITYLNGTASVLQEYNLTNCTSLSKLILIGEEFTESRCKKLRQNYNGRIINEYGFTESALVTAMKIFDPDTPRVDRTIGKPLRNVKCYILDKDLKQLPLQTIGELHIGGMGISRGYLNRPHLTDDKFIPNPYQTREEKDAGFNSKMYKTGDLARWTANGEVEYIGRNDFQIKLRGVRIEPAEIESIVMKYEGLKKCTIVVKSTKSEEESTASSKHLVGYFVVGDGIDILEHELIMHLEKNLPRYMIPARMVQVKDIPVTINGKIDFRSLPNVVDLGGDQAKLDYTPPRNEMESKLCQIWGETLNLKKTRVGITDDFFRLGGHSITCIQLIAKIRQQLKIHITLEQIFKLRTIQKLADSLLEDENHNDLLAPNDSISAKDDDTIIPANHSSLLANSLQQGLMYHHMKQLDTPDDAYIMQSLYKYETPLDILHYKKSWKAAQQKYVSLRLNFRVEKEIYQVVNHEKELSWNYKSLKDLQPEEQELKISQAQKADREKGYRLESESLFRIHLFELKQNSFILLFSCHHVIIDGWSFPILFSFVHEQYLNLLHGSGVAIPSARSDSIDEAYLQAQFYLQSHRKDNLSHWTKQVEKIENRSNLSVLLRDEVRYQTQLNDYDRVQDQRQETVEFGPELVSKLKTISGITLHSILQFVWHKVLHVYGSGRQTIVGTTVSGRNLPIDGIERSVGLYINTLPLIVDHAEQNGLCVLDALELIQGKVIEMNSRSNIELGSLHNNTGLKHGLFDTLFVLENYPNLDNSRVEFQRKELGFKFLSEVEKLDYPLAVIVREVLETKEGGGGGGGLKFTLCYAGELFDLEIVQDLLALVTQLLWQIVDSPESKLVTKLNCLLPKHESLLDGWNNCTRQQFPRESTLHKIFEQVAHKFPDKVAVTYENVSLTYAQLNKRANQLANYLKNLTTIRPNDKVALILNKNELMILSIFGVWKSGAAYVPVDPSYPDERIQFILKDTQAKIIITNSTSASRVQTLSCSDQCVIQIEEVSQQRLHNLDSENPTAVSTCTDLAYIIYTSGTTGNPKGVMIEHRGVVNLQNSLAQIFSLQDNHDEVILSFSNYVFDHFVEQMVDALLNGQTLVVLNDEMRSDKDRLYEYMRANKVTYLSGTPSVLSLYEYRDLPHLKRIDAVGEDFSEPLFNKIRSTFSGLIINGYGPTEVSITSHKRLYPDPSERRLNKSIGHPVGNTTCYILDENMQRLPSGAIGDLYLGGVGVGRGYLNRDDLTDKAFVRNPFADGDEDNARLYKTGDLCRFLSNGEVDYMGRNDFQVKVHGLRIELCEIEAAMLSYPPGSRITQCVEIPATKLPGYMVPKRLVPIDKIPVNISGKVDTKQLSQPVMMERLGFSPPQNELETKLCTIWGEILQLPEDQIGITDDFFGLGGDSFTETITVLKRDGNGTSAFNVPFYFELSKTVNLGILQESIRSVIKRHEILRTLILTGRLTKASQYIFSLDKELPLKVTIYEIEDTPTTIMCLVFHHICFDGWSWGVFQRDLKSLYANNRPSKFSYKGKELRFHISLETTRGLKELSKMLKTSMFSVLISAYSLTLSYYTNQKDILIGYPVSNRNLPEFENVIGFFVNLLPLRSRINPEESLAQYIRTVGEEIIQSQAHQDMPFDKLVNPLKLNPYEPNISATTAKYDLSTTMTEVEESGIEGTATFATKLFRDATIENFLKTYAHVLEQFFKHGVGKLETASLLTRNTKPSQDDNTPSSIFDEIATKFGYKTALVSLENGETTYSELSSKANQLAYYLLSKFDPKPDDIIALFLDKSEPMISSILAVWKTGAAYVPIDPEFPSERISFILKDTKAKILLTSEKYGAVLRKSITSNGNLAIVGD